jgi:hypothetical protein
MDPNANLREQLEISRLVAEQDNCHPNQKLSQDDLVVLLDRLAELVEALHSWIIQGGHLPEAWSHVRSS